MRAAPLCLVDLSIETTAENLLSGDWRSLNGRLPPKSIDEFVKNIACPHTGSEFATAFLNADPVKAAYFIGGLIKENTEESLNAATQFADKTGKALQITSGIHGTPNRYEFF